MTDAAANRCWRTEASLCGQADQAKGPLPRGIARAIRVAVAAAVVGLAAAQPVEAAELRRLKIGVPDLEIFYYQGVVVDGDALRLQTELAKLAPNKRVVILMNSPGGVHQEGRTLGRLFYNARFATFILGNGGICMSACATAFLGGRDSVTGEPLRAIIQGGSLGFHQFHTKFTPEQKFTKKDLEKSVADVQKIVFDDLKYFKEINQDPRTYRRHITEPGESMLVIRDSAALENGFHVISAETRTLISPDKMLDRMKAK